MFIRKWTKDAELEKDEKVLTGKVSVNIRDGNGLKNEIRPGTKYIVSGDYVKEFFESPVKKKTVKIKEV